MKKIITLLLISTIIFAPMAQAQNPARKLLRGTVNILTGWIELPKNIYDTSVEETMLSGLTMGVAKGVGMVIVRTGCGVYELVTFPFPVPEDYEVILEPEFVFEASSNAYIESPITYENLERVE